VKHSGNVLSEAAQALSLAKDIESGGRGYIITGDSNYLEPFTIAKNNIFSDINRLKELTKDNSYQQERIDSLSKLVDRQISFSQQCIQLRNEKGLAEASKLIMTRSDKAYTDQIRKITAEIQQVENNLLILRQNENGKSKVSFNRAFFTFLAGVFALLIIILIAIWNHIAMRKKGEEQSRENGDQIQTIFNTAPDAVIVIDEESRIIKWNLKAETLFGWKADEVMGRPLNEIIIPTRYREAHKAGMKHFLKTGEGPVLDKTIEIQAINRNHIEFDVALSISPTLVNGGYLFIGFLRDITEKKKAEEKIKEEEQKFSTLFYKSPIMKAITDVSTGSYLEINDAMAGFFERPKEEIIGKTAIELNMLFRPEEREQILTDIIKDGFVRGVETEITSKNGKSRWVSSSIDKINLNGKDCFLTAAVDITQRKQAEEKIRQMNIELEKRVEEKTHEVIANEKRFRTLIEKSSDMMTLATPDGKLLYSSPSLTNVLGYSEEELRATPVFEMIHPEDVPGLIKQMQQIMETPGKSFFLQQRLLHKNGRWIWCEGMVTNLMNESSIKALVSNFRDVTERKEAEQALNESQQLLQAIIDNSTAIIYVKNLQGQYLLVNRRFAEVFHLSPGSALGKTDYDFFPKADANAYRQMDVRTAAADHALTEEEKVPQQDGLHTYISVKSTLLDDAGEPYAIFGISTDITELKVVEENLRKSLREISDYKYALDESSIVAITDQKGIINYVNNNFCKISKYSREELIGQDHRIINSGYHPKEFIRDLWITIANGKIWKGELKNKAKDGSIYWIDTTIVPFLDDNGKPYQYIAIQADITERKLAEDNLAASEMRFRSLIENSAEGIALIDEFSNVFYRSPAAEKITGMLPLGKTIGLTHPDDLETIKNIRNEVFKKPGIPIAFQGRFLHAAGHYFWMEGTFTNLLHVKEVKAVVANYRDVTQRKEAEEKIVKSEKIYKAIASSIPGTVICLLDLNFRYLLIEGDMLEKLGFSKEKLLGNKAEDVLLPEFFAEIQKVFERVLKGETITRESSRAGYDIISRFIPLKDENDAVYAIMTVAIDVTKLKNAQRDIIKLNQELEERIIERTRQLKKSNEELEAFSYSVSHDLRAPLRGIIGFTAILEEDYSSKLDDEAKRITSVIKNNTIKMGQLIDDLLAFSRMGRQDIAKKNINTTAMVHEVIKELTPGNGDSIEWVIHPLPATVADMNTIRQVWVNLISNAIKYSGEKQNPRIEIGTFNGENHTIFFIRDNGVGFDEKYSGKLFK
ncbi:MAG: hypothetical protein JWM28_842, partial [Chitinophagaceae bacterium]|nr:hypothetical protein [Chitinophagaceae bacterium]